VSKQAIINALRKAGVAVRSSGGTKRFTVEIEMEIRKRYEAGEGTMLLCELYKCCPSLIIQSIRNVGGSVNYRMVTLDEAKQFRKEYEQGVNTVKLGNKYGWTGCTVSRAITSVGGEIRSLKERHEVFNDRQAKVLLEEYNKGATLQQLATKYQCNPVTVSNTIRRIGGEIRAIWDSRRMGL